MPKQKDLVPSGRQAHGEPFYVTTSARWPVGPVARCGGLCKSSMPASALISYCSDACTQVGSPSGCRARQIMRACSTAQYYCECMSAGGPRGSPAGRSSSAMVGMHAIDHMHNLNPDRGSPLDPPRHSHTGDLSSRRALLYSIYDTPGWPCTPVAHPHARADMNTTLSGFTGICLIK